MRILHILHDVKFADKHIYKFEEGSFDNDYVFLEENFSYTGKYQEKIRHIVPHSAEYVQLIEDIPGTYQVVMVYYLSIDKAYLVNRIGSNKVKVIWNFYGADLYNLPAVKDNLYGKATIGLLGYGLARELYANVKSLGKTLIYSLLRRKTYVQEIYAAIARIDYLAWYSKEEYDYLNKFFDGKLPRFLQLSISNRIENVAVKEHKKNGVLVGNSRSPYNNHADTFEILNNNGFDGEVLVPFSYGNYNKYSAALKKYAAGSKLNIRFSEDFEPYETYINTINQYSAAIYNCYRQMGLGNIFIAIRCGLKIYLSEKNPILKWMRNQGFAVFSIENDLDKDLKKHDLVLSPDIARKNNDLYTQISDKKHNAAFLETIQRLQ